MRTLAALILLAAPAWAEGGPSVESIERLTQAIAAAGCKVDALNEGTILAEAEMEEAEAGVIVSLLIERGEAEVTDNVLHLKYGACK